MTLPDWFARGLATSPNTPALSINTLSWTYGELHEIALRWAGSLCDRAAGKPKRIGVVAYRSLEMYAGILAALYAGAAVVPISPAFPAERIAGMVRAAELDAVIVDDSGQAVMATVLAGRSVPLLTSRTLDEGTPSASGVPEPSMPQDEAYVLFTSGSTGTPKGVRITHANLDAFLRYNFTRYDFTADDVCSQTFDTTFDLAVFDLFMAWGAGANLVSTPPQALAALPDFVRAHGLTVWFSVPSTISLVRRTGKLGRGSLPTLRWSLFCGEPLSQADVEHWQSAAPRSSLENLYGPTELTIACSAYPWSPQDSPAECRNGMVPLGPLYPGHRALLLDADDRPDPAEGELCVAGPQTFPGYLDPADDVGRIFEHDGERWYRTGDRVRARASGYLYLGRTDHQIKIRGYRIEPAEVEHTVRQLDGVDEAVALPVEIGRKRELAVFYTGAAMPVATLRSQVADKLPDVMVPRWAWHLTEFPVNSNGKIDRGRLMKEAAQRVQTS